MPRKPRSSRTAGKARRASAALKGDAISRTILGRQVQGRLKAFGLTQAMAASIVDDAATQMSRLANGHYIEFSADRLVKMLLRLGSDVTVTIKHARSLGRRGRSRVRVA
jgi:predicted XRE-type DNA-binding protein